MFCVECGLCALDVTGSGTVIAPPPERPALIGREMLQSVDRLIAELELESAAPPAEPATETDDFHIELVEDDIEVVDEEEQPTRQYTKAMLRDLLAGRTPRSSRMPPSPRAAQPSRPPQPRRRRATPRQPVQRRITAAYGVIES